MSFKPEKPDQALRKSMPSDAIIAELEQQLSGYDRTPFHQQLARAIACGPSKTAWRKLATNAPDKWARSITELSRAAGFAEIKAQVIIKPDPKQVAVELVARFGRDKALIMLTAAGLPSTLVGETIEHVPA